MGRLPRSGRVQSLALAAAMAVMLAAISGCGHRRTTAQLPAPQAAPPSMEPSYPSQPPQQSSRIPMTRIPLGGVSQEDLEYILTHRPIYSQEGEATWYTTPYKGRRAANGQVFDDNALTAAHRTLPMGSLIVVTNLITRQASAMRINDRGPFVPDRVIDLSKASAKAIGMYFKGVAPVRIDVYYTPKPMDFGGRWCVQIGAFTSERKARKLKERLLHRYPRAHVIEFPAEHDYWVRIRPQGDNREMAEYIASHVHPSQGDAYLTRLD